MVSYAWYLSWNVYHKFIYQCKMIKLFLEIFIYFTRFIKIILTPVSDPKQWLTGQVGRPHGRPNQGPVDPSVDRRAQVCARLARQWAGRPDQRALLSVSGRSTGSPNGHIYDRWRSTAGLSGCQISLTAIFLVGLYKPHFFGILAKIFKSKNSSFLKCF